MSIRNILFATAFALASLGATRADVVSVLAPGQRVVLSTPQAGALEISRQGDSVLVRKDNEALD
jgi:hypothetical protein